MSYNYLLALHERIDLKLQEAQDMKGENATDKAFTKGRIAALEEFKAHIGSMYNHKLPKRLLKRLNENKARGWITS